MPKGTHDRSQFQGKWGLFSVLGEDLEIQRKGVFGGEIGGKIRDFHKARTLAIDAYG